MANNRMALVCKRCQVGLGFAKYYPHTDWYWSGNAEKLEKFIEDHSKCFERSSAMELMGEGEPFYLGYEWDDRGWNHGVDVKLEPPNPFGCPLLEDQ